MKTVCDSRAGVFLNAEFVEGKQVDSQKEYLMEFGSTTATTIRLCRPWRGSKKTVIGDAWFGSKKTAEELAEFGLRSVLSVKNAHKGYPKAEILSKIPNRGDVYTMQSKINLGYEGEGREVRLLAMGHRDKKPMLVVGTAGLLVDGPPRVRNRYKYQDGEVVHQQWIMTQPHMMAVYRANFNAIDVLNKMSLGRQSVVTAVGTRTWWKRVMMALVSMSALNTYHAWVRPFERGL